MGCVSCDSLDFSVLGNVGNRRYYKCNRCGLEWNRKIDQIENDKATIRYNY